MYENLQIHAMRATFHIVFSVRNRNVKRGQTGGQPPVWHGTENPQAGSLSSTTSSYTLDTDTDRRGFHVYRRGPA